jgi:hypothetical protein
MLMDDRTYHLVRSFLKKEKNEGLTRFSTMGIQLIGLGEKDREPTMSRLTRSTTQETFKRYLIDKSYKIGKYR